MTYFCLDLIKIADDRIDRLQGILNDIARVLAEQIGDDAYRMRQEEIPGALRSLFNREA